MMRASLLGDSGALRALIDRIIAEESVPGAALGVLSHGSQTIVSAGVLSRQSQRPVTDNCLFQIGSITKVWTATMVMVLQDRGLLDVDRPVDELLPGFCVADTDATRELTIRHLLSHTSGIPGDFFVDTGSGDDCVARYVDQLHDLELMHSPGTAVSYCNTGFVVAARIVEVITGQTWDEALQSLVAEPLGLTHNTTLPVEELQRHSAVGHTVDGQVVPRRWALPRSIGPAGSITASIGDLIRFAATHLQPGGAPRDDRLLSAAATNAMRTNPFIDACDPRVEGGSWGLGWERRRWAGGEVIGHNGITLGQTAFLWLSPEHDTTVGLLTNSAMGARVFRRVMVEVVGEEPTSAELSESRTPPFDEQRAALALNQCAGKYCNDSGEITIVSDPPSTIGTMFYQPIGTKPKWLPSPQRTFAISAAGTDIFNLTDLRDGERMVLRFDSTSDRGSDSVFYDMRTHRRVE